jgi:hypothetical protein
MNPVTEVKTSPNPASELRVAGGASATTALANPTTTISAPVYTDGAR